MIASRMVAKASNDQAHRPLRSVSEAAVRWSATLGHSLIEIDDFNIKVLFYSMAFSQKFIKCIKRSCMKIPFSTFYAYFCLNTLNNL